MNLIENYNIPVIAKAIRLMGKKSKLFLTCILLFCAVEIVGTIMNTYGIKGVVSSLGEHNYILFWHSLLLIVISICLWWAYAPVSTYLCDVASKAAIRDIKTNLCGHIISLPMEYHDTKATGELLSAVTNDTSCLQEIYDWSFFQVLRSALGGANGVIIMATIDWHFAIVVIILGILSVTTTSYFSKKLEKAGGDIQEQLAKNSTDVYELVKAAKTIRLLDLTGAKAAGIHSGTELEAKLKIKSGKITSRMNAIVLGITTFTYTAILFIGALFVYFKLSDWGTVVALMGLKYTTDMLFSECGTFMAGMQKNVAGVKRLFEITNTPKERILRKLSFTINKMADPDTSLSISNVSFSYNESAPVLDNFNMLIENNKLTALVGESGSGKSTIMKLILGLYEPKDGSISFSGNAESDEDDEVTLQSIRSKTAYVPQDAMLFRGSIYDNIACGNEKASKDDIESAAKLAGAHEFICSLENGYDTIILDDGKSLSGGQKQRIAIARALVKNAPILLLDEVTSALDRQTEKRILETIKNISRTKAVLFITHRNDVIKWADRVYTVSST